MTEPNAHYELQESRGREPDQHEQDWLRAERDEQEWLRAQQAKQKQRDRRTSRTPARSAERYLMDCLKCKDLEQAFESRLSNYSEARSAAFYQVSTELAAQKKVDMERARNDLEEHQLICPLASRVAMIA